MSTRGECTVYMLLDPRKGQVKIGRKVVQHEPFYVGKGTGYRHEHHFNERNCTTYNKFKNRVINKILRETGGPPVTFIWKDGLAEEVAYAMESDLICRIGRRDLGKGPLVNLSDGGEGVRGSKWTASRRRLNGKRAKEAWERKSKAEKDEIVAKQQATKLRRGKSCAPKTPYSERSGAAKKKNVNRGREAAQRHWDSMTETEREARLKKLAKNRKRALEACRINKEEVQKKRVKSWQKTVGSRSKSRNKEICSAIAYGIASMTDECRKSRNDKAAVSLRKRFSGVDGARRRDEVSAKSKVVWASMSQEKKDQHRDKCRMAALKRWENARKEKIESSGKKATSRAKSSRPKRVGGAVSKSER